MKLARQSKVLTTNRHQAPVTLNLQDNPSQSLHRNRCGRYFSGVGFSSLLNKLPEASESTPGNKTVATTAHQIKISYRLVNYHRSSGSHGCPFI